MVRFHLHWIDDPTVVYCGADVVSVITEMGDYFKKEFNWKLESCTTWVRRISKEKENADTHFRWSEPVGPFGLLPESGGSPSLSRAPCAKDLELGKLQW